MKIADGSQAVFQNAAASIKDWLLSAAQIQQGPHRGAIVGGLDQDNRPNYAYGEITGYYLTFLAFLAATGAPRAGLERHAAGALDWIARSYADGRVPPTRAYLAGELADWRNHLIFSFDLAMILRGLHLASAAGLVDPVTCASAADAVSKTLVRCIGPDGALLSHIPRTAASERPEVKWSTTQGPFQLKTAAAIGSARFAGLPAELQASARTTFNRWRHHVQGDAVTDELHPLLYSLEGLAISALEGGDAGDLRHAAVVFGAVVRQVARGLTEACGRTAADVRSDVLAQLVRLGCILRRTGALSAGDWDVHANALSHGLLHFMDADGAVCFNRPAPAAGGPSQIRPVKPALTKNTWCAMFAFQAFYFMSHRAGDGAPAPEPLSLIV
jgi:hypothetical protein